MDIIEQWKSEGRFRPSHILDQIEFTSRFRLGKIRSDMHELSEDEFTALLLTASGLPSSCQGLGHFAYQIITYLSSAPFYDRKPRSSVTLTEIYRGLAWLVPNHMRSGSTGGRTRTSADERRLLFQSLATTSINGPQDRVKERQRANHNAFFMPEPLYRDMDWLHPNYCNDGDEMFNDVLDTMFIFQHEPDGFPLWGPVPREDFREMAKELVEEKDRFKLHTLAIPLDQFTTLIGVLLALQFAYEDKEKPALSQFNDSATYIAGSFCKDEFSKVITWPEFDDMLPQMPFLFDPLHRLLAAVLIEQEPFEITRPFIAPMPPRDSFMTLASLSQLASVVNNDVDFESFDRAHQWNKGVRPGGRVLANALKSMPELSILALKGSSPSGENFIFGIFNPLPAELETRKKKDDNDLDWPLDPDDQYGHHLDAYKLDGVHDRLEYRGTVMFPARPHLFILSPAQSVVRFEGEPRIDGDRLCFGDALKMLDDGTAFIKDGDRDVRVKTSSIEIWGETPKQLKEGEE